MRLDVIAHAASPAVLRANPRKQDSASGKVIQVPPCAPCATRCLRRRSRSVPRACRRLGGR